MTSELDSVVSETIAANSLRLVVEAAPVGMLGIDLSGRIVLVNRYTEAMFGYSRVDLIGEHVELLIPARFRRHVAYREAFASAPNTRVMGEGRDLYAVRKDGAEFPVEIGLNPIRTVSGDMILAAITDITARKAAEAIREDAYSDLQRLAAIVESSDDAIFSKDTYGVITSWNRSASLLFGYSADEAIGKSMRMLVPPDRQHEEDDILEAIGQGKRVQHLDTVRLHRDGHAIPVSATISPITDSAGAIIGASGILRDITERQRAETQVQAHAAELLRSNADLEQFAYTTSHDLQEPLRAIAGFVQLLQRRLQSQLDAKSQEYVEHVVDGVHRMQRLIDDLLSYSRVSSRKIESTEVSLNAVVREAKANLAAAIKESKAEIDVASLPTVKGDATRLTQLFQNLIGNALKYTKHSVPVISITCPVQGDQCVIAVRDNGIGIEERFFERIFGVFQRLHSREEYPGSGIGLALCAKIVAAHGGKIWVESQVGVGSTFFVSLPRSVSERSVEPAP